MEKYRVSIINVGKWFLEQLSHPHSLFKRKSWGVFSVFSHIRRSDRLPKKIEDSKEKALRTARFMADKYGGQYSVYKCIYCNGWHIAKDQTVKRPVAPVEEKPHIPTEPKMEISISNGIDLEKILTLNIPDMAPVYGGVRGRTMSSKHQNFAWPTIKESGIHTIIDLREDGNYTRLNYLCKQHGLEYFYFPIFKNAANIQSIIENFDEFCKRIDRGHFYISCAMGLHRTDIALCTYWTFHGADVGMPPPVIKGFHHSTGRKMDKVMRFLNTFFEGLANSDIDIISSEIFKKRKQILIECSRN